MNNVLSLYARSNSITWGSLEEKTNMLGRPESLMKFLYPIYLKLYCRSSRKSQHESLLWVEGNDLDRRDVNPRLQKKVDEDRRHFRTVLRL